MQERTPRDIKRGFRKPTTGDAANVQIFVNDCTIAPDQGAGGFVMKIPPQIADSLMLLLQRMDSFRAALAALLSPRCIALRPSERGLRLPVVVRRCNAFTLGCNQEGFQAKIDADCRAGGRRNCRIAQAARKDDIPTIGFPLERDRLNLAFDWTVHLDLHAPNVLEIDTAPVKPATVAHRRKLHRIKAVSSLKARIARRLRGFQAPKERLKRLIQSAQGRLTTGKVGRGEEGVRFACRLQLIRLFAIGDTALCLLPLLFPLRQRGVVQPPMGFEHRAHRGVLLTGWVEAVFEGFSHGLASLLLLDVLLNRVSRNVPGAADVVRPAPQRRKAAFQAGELIAQHAGCIALELVGEILRRVG